MASNNCAAVRFVADRIEGASHLPDALPVMQRELQRFLADRRREMLRPEPAISKEALAARCARMRNLGGWR